MTSIVTPSDQQISIDPYTSKLFDFNNASSRVYLSRTVNNLLRTFGTDVILEELFIDEIQYDSTNETVSITITPGKCIIDTTLIEFPNQTTIEMNLSGYDQTGSLLLFISFRYTESVHLNTAKFKLLYVDPTNRFTYPEQIETNTERVLLAKFIFNKETNNIEKSLDKTASVGSSSYDIYPVTNIIKSVRNYVNLLFN